MSRRLPVASTVLRGTLGGIKNAYEHLGLSALHSFLWFLLHIPLWWVLQGAANAAVAALTGDKTAVGVPWGLYALLAAAFGAFLAAPANAGLMYVVKLTREDEARIRDFFIGMKRHYWRAVSVYGSFLLAVAFLLANTAAARRIMQAGSGVQDLMAVASLVLSLNVLIFVLLLSNYLTPFIVLQPNNWLKVWKKAALLTLDNGLLTLLLGCVTVILYGISLATGIFLVLYYPAAIGHGHFLVFSAVLDKYEEADAAQEAAGTDGSGEATP